MSEHRYTIIVPGIERENVADIFSIDHLMDLDFAWEDAPGENHMAVVRNPTNVVIIDNRCPKTVDELRSEMDEFMRKKTDTDEDDMMEYLSRRKRDREKRETCYQ